MKCKYRIVEDGNGELIAQKQIQLAGDNIRKWIFFLDLEDCEGDIDKAETVLKRAIERQKHKVLRHYSDDGELIQ